MPSTEPIYPLNGSANFPRFGMVLLEARALPHQCQRIVFGGFAPVARLLLLFIRPVEGQCDRLLLAKPLGHHSFKRIDAWRGFRQSPVDMRHLVPDRADIRPHIGRSLKRDDPGLASQPLKK